MFTQTSHTWPTTCKDTMASFLSLSSVLHKMQVIDPSFLHKKEGKRRHGQTYTNRRERRGTHTPYFIVGIKRRRKRGFADWTFFVFSRILLSMLLPLLLHARQTERETFLEKTAPTRCCMNNRYRSSVHAFFFLLFLCKNDGSMTCILCNTLERERKEAIVSLHVVGHVCDVCVNMPHAPTVFNRGPGKPSREKREAWGKKGTWMKQQKRA